MKKNRFFALLSLILCGVIISTQFSANAEAANIQMNDGKLQVFIGSTDGMSSIQANNYSKTQSNLLDNLSVATPNDIGPALITFDSFLSTSEATALLSAVDSIDTVYMWIPNKEGRAIIDVANNDIDNSINYFFASLDLDNATNEDYRRDMLELMEEYGIFAADVKAEYSALDSLVGQAGIANVDIIYSEVAVAMAAETHQPISYICIPDKPDGTA